MNVKGKLVEWLKRFVNSRFRFLLPVVIVLLLISIVYFINGVYPFGSNTLVNGDLGKAYLPIYYYMYDLFDGKVSLFMNFKVGLGTDMYDLISIYGILSPVNWLLSLTTRENLPNFLSYLFIIRLCLLAVTSFFCFDKVYDKALYGWKVLFSVLYAFSGWVIVYHTNFVWLDNVILFPILLLGFKRIVDYGDYKLYMLILFLSVIYSFYITFMEVVFILFLSFGYLHFFCRKEEKGKFICNLGLGTMLALGLSMVFVFPTLVRVFGSARISYFNNVDIISDLPDKLLVVCMYALPIILFVVMLFSKRGDRKKRGFYLYLAIMLLSGVVFNQINVMWHSGSYVVFPYRYSFIVVMVIYLGALYYLSYNPKLEFKVVRNYRFYIWLCFVLLVYLYCQYVPVSASSDPALFLSNFYVIFYVLLLVGVSLFLIVFVLFLPNLLLKKICLVLVLIFSCVGWSLGYVGISSDELLNETTDYSFRIGNELYKELADDTNFVRYKNLDSNLITNYGFIIDKPTISNWHMVDVKSVKLLGKLGYTTYFAALTDIGGTLFSDSLLGVDRYISSGYLDGNLYELIDSNGNFNLYAGKYSFVSEIVADELDYSLELEGNPFEIQNRLYQDLFGREDNILDGVRYRVGETDENIYVEKGKVCARGKNGEISFYLEVDDYSELYFYYDSIEYFGDDEYLKNADVSILYLKVNDELLYNADVNEKFRKLFLDDTGIIDLGLYDQEVVKLTLLLNEDSCVNDFSFAKINLEKFKKLAEDNNEDVGVVVDKNRLVVNVNNVGDKNLFLPISYSDNYLCKVNGKEVSVKEYMEGFTIIPLEEGENQVELVYYPSYLKICFVISGGFLLLFLVLERFKLVGSKWWLRIFSLFYYLILVVMFFYVYIYGFIR